MWKLCIYKERKVLVVSLVYAEYSLSRTLLSYATGLPAVSCMDKK